MNLPQQGSNTQLTSSKTSRAAAGEGGFLFEMNMAAFIGLRGMQRGDNFELSSNNEGVGNFDDLVYTADNRRYYLQLKYSGISEKKLEEKELKTLLQKCFETFCKIKSSEALEKIKTDNMKFIIYTNRKLDPNLRWSRKVHKGDDIFFKTCDKGIFTFSPNIQERNNYVRTFLKNSIEKRKIVWDSEYSGLPSLVVTINVFLNQLIMVTGQKDNQELDALIAEEIKNIDTIKLDEKECISILYHFKIPLGAWWRNSKNRKCMTPEMLSNWLQRAKTEHFTPFVTGLNNSCTMKLDGTGIKFSDKEVSRLHAEMSDERVVHVRSDALTLCSILLLNYLKTSKYIFVNFKSLQNNKDMLLYAWFEGDWEWLIVFCNSTVQQRDVSGTCHDISKIIPRDSSSKRVIILTACSVPQITDFVPIKHKFKFEQLSKESQVMLLDKKVDFQGCQVTMRSVVQRHGNVEHVLRPELVTDLITEGTAVNIGGTLQQNTEHYEPRVFKRKIWLSLDIVRNRDTYPDIFAVSGMEENDLVDIVPSEEKVGSFLAEDNITDNSTQNNDVLEKRFIVLKGRNMMSSFLKLCEIHSRETLHWLKYKDGKLLWKQTRGGLQNPLNFIDAEKTGIDERIVRACMKSGSCEVNEESIWNLGERTVLVVAEPGMGKSNTTTQVAWNTKLADPTSWVVRINWNDHTKKLQKIDAATFNFDSLVEFLCSAGLTESKYTDIDRILIKQALQNSENVTVLMDGFDEISPTHADKTAAIVSELMKTKVGGVWITSRPVQRERLEKNLSVIALSMKKMPYESQIKVFRDIWKTKATEDTEECLNVYVESLVRHTNNSVHQRNFTGCPIYIMMIANAFEGNLDTSLQKRKISLPHKLDLLELYDTFIAGKLHIYETEKKKEDLTNSSRRDDHESWMEIYMENLEKCTILVTLSSELNPLTDAEKQTTLQPFVERIQAGRDKIGIVMNVVEEMPHFVHRTFAEYLTARWFSKNFESNRSLLEGILFDSSYGIVKDVFDRILAKDCPLHCAVLDWDTEAVETLLEEGYDVNAVDSGGRTALHLIAAQGPGDPVCEGITNSLLWHEATVDTEDKLLQWTALEYAITAGNMVVRRLLEQR